MKRIDWQMLWDDVFILLLISPIVITLGVGVYALMMLLLR